MFDRRVFLQGLVATAAGLIMPSLDVADRAGERRVWALNRTHLVAADRSVEFVSKRGASPATAGNAGSYILVRARAYEWDRTPVDPDDALPGLQRSAAIASSLHLHEGIEIVLPSRRLILSGPLVIPVDNACIDFGGAVIEPR